MPTYHLQCGDCSHQVFLKQGMTEALPTTCPQCGEETLQTVFHAATVIDLTPRTVGAQADRNTERMGLYEVQEKRQELAAIRQRGRAEINLPPGMESARPEKYEAPWYRPGTTGPDLSLARLSPEQRTKFIEEGKA